MKKILSALSAVVFLANLVVLSSCASNSAVSDKKADSDLCEPVLIDYVKEERGNLSVTNQPQVELLFILCRLAGVDQFGGYYTDDNSYNEQTSTLFAKYKDYEIVNWIKEFCSKGVTPDGFVSLAYHIKPDFSGTTVSLNPKPETLHFSWNNIPSSEIYSFIKVLNKFAKDSNFERIYTLLKSQNLSDCLSIADFLNKYKYDEWLSNFFTKDKNQHVYINISRSNCAYSYYDFAFDEDYNRNFYLTEYIGANLFSFADCYCLCYAQLYASSNWETVKDAYTKFMKAVNIRAAGDNKEAVKNIEGMKFTEFHLAKTLSTLIASCYLADVVGEVDEIPGLLDEYKNNTEKVYGHEFAESVFALVQNYIDNRDIYPDFEAYYPELNKFLLNLPEVE